MVAPHFRYEDSPTWRQEVSKLKKQIRKLKKRVKELEAERPSNLAGPSKEMDYNEHGEILNNSERGPGKPPSGCSGAGSSSRGRGTYC